MRVDGAFAVAEVSIPVGPRVMRTQWSLLRRRNSAWKVLDSVTDRPRYLPCWASTPVMQKIAGGCFGQQPVGDVGGIFGPRSARSPTPTERRGVVAAAKRAIGLYGHDSCIIYRVTVSRLNPRYARIDFVFHKPYGNCHLFNGIDIVKKTSGGWKIIGEGSVAFPCVYAPPGVVRSLYGGCETLKR